MRLAVLVLCVALSMTVERGAALADAPDPPSASPAPAGGPGGAAEPDDVDAAGRERRVALDVAKSLFDTAVVRASEGNWEAAEALFARSRAVVDRPVTALNQGLALVHLGRTREAWRALGEAEAMCGPDETDTCALVVSARKRVAPQLADVELRVDPPSATLRVDDEEVPLRDGRAVVLLEPGLHHFAWLAQGYEAARAELLLHQAEHRTYPVVLRPALPRAEEHPVAPPLTGGAVASERPAGEARSRRARWLWAVGGTVVAVAAVGVIVALRPEDAAGPDGGRSGRVFSPE